MSTSRSNHTKRHFGVILTTLVLVLGSRQVQAAIQLYQDSDLLYTFNNYYGVEDPETLLLGPVSIPSRDIGTSGPGSHKDGYPNPQGDANFSHYAGPWQAAVRFIIPDNLDAEFTPGAVDSPHPGIHITDHGGDDHLLFQTHGALGSIMRVTMNNASMQPIPELQISYEAQNLSVAKGDPHLLGDVPGWENVGLYFFTLGWGSLDSAYSSYFGQDVSILNFTNNTGTRSTVSATIGTFRGGWSDQPMMPGEDRTFYIMQDYTEAAARFDTLDNAYLLDNLRIRVVPEPSVAAMLTLLVGLFSTRRRK